jgi:predicted transposase/invertase (TIGR01784 family)
MSSKNKSPVEQPHDKLIRRLLSSVPTARDILESYLPHEVNALIDLDTLERQPDTFVDAQHRKHEIDVLFKTQCKNTKKEAYIWVLIEQQRDPDVWLPLRIFGYIAVIWDNFRKKYSSRAQSVKIPFIYPLIISNATKPYPHSLALRDLIEPEEAVLLFDNLFKTPIQLIDLAALPDEKLRIHLQQHIRAHALLLSLKHVFDANLQSILETSLVVAFKKLEEMGFKDDVADLLYYLYNEGNLIDSEQFWAFLHQKFSSDVEEKVMTLGQRDRQQAVQQAAQQEKIKVLQETALRMLEKKLDIALISEVTSLTPKEISQLVKKTL